MQYVEGGEHNLEAGTSIIPLKYVKGNITNNLKAIGFMLNRILRATFIASELKELSYNPTQQLREIEIPY